MDIYNCCIFQLVKANQFPAQKPLSVNSVIIYLFSFLLNWFTQKWAADERDSNPVRVSGTTPYRLSHVPFALNFTHQSVLSESRKLYFWFSNFKFQISSLIADYINLPEKKDFSEKIHHPTMDFQLPGKKSGWKFVLGRALFFSPGVCKTQGDEIFPVKNFTPSTLSASGGEVIRERRERAIPAKCESDTFDYSL